MGQGFKGGIAISDRALAVMIAAAVVLAVLDFLVLGSFSHFFLTPLTTILCGIVISVLAWIGIVNAEHSALHWRQATFGWVSLCVVGGPMILVGLVRLITSLFS